MFKIKERKLVKWLYKPVILLILTFTFVYLMVFIYEHGFEAVGRTIIAFMFILAFDKLLSDFSYRWNTWDYEVKLDEEKEDA